MSLQGKIKRLYLITEKIGKSKYPPTLEEIVEFLKGEGFDNNERTIQRDLEGLRYEFGIQVDCDRSTNTYSINYEKSLEINSFLQILNTAITADILMESIKDYSKMLDYIQLGSDASLKGIGILKDILYAVRNSREISFDYLPFYMEQPKNYRLQPYMLKEYLNRWYIVGLDLEVGIFKTFGIDRIEQMEVHTETFIRNKKRDPKELFEHTIGLDYNYADAERVVLSFTPYQAKYIKTQPWHPSQQIVEENENECLVELYVCPNFELQQRILMNAAEIKVVEPEWLKDKILEMLRSTIERYDK